MSISRRIVERLRREEAPRLEREPAISDEQLRRTLGVYAGLVDRVLDQPEHWLDVERSTRPRGADTLRKAGQRLRRTVSGEAHPGVAGWDQRPLGQRVDWWLRRIALTAGTAAAAPRFAGLLADRIPVQDALGASASGLAVCAVARENGIETPDRWVPLLAQVIFDREIRPESSTVPDTVASEHALDAAAADLGEPPSALQRLGEGGQRAVRVMWRLARTLLEIQDIFDHRPRGGRLARLLGRLPVVGVAAGWLDERGAIRAAARETQQLVELVA